MATPSSFACRAVSAIRATNTSSRGDLTTVIETAALVPSNEVHEDRPNAIERTSRGRCGGDNGGSMEGNLTGSLNDTTFFNGEVLDAEEQLEIIEKSSFAYTFEDPKADERHNVQYFEVLGSRAIYKDG